MDFVENEFDVIIVGAGPAGAQCARELVKKGYKVLLIEKSKEIGEPNFSSVGTTDYTMEEFGIPQDVIADYWDGFLGVGPTKQVLWEYQKLRGYVLQFNKLKRFLISDGEEHGLEVYVGTAVTEPVIENGKVVGVAYAGIEKGEVTAKIIVDASGPPGVIASKVGLRPAVLSASTVALEYIMDNITFPRPHTLEFYAGPSWLLNGYAWIFPFGEKQAKVGVIVYDSSEHASHDALIDLLKGFIEKIPWLASAQPLELHGSSLYITGGIDHHVKDNVVVIGDAAAQINPLVAEGIRHALRSGRMAAESIDEVLKTGDTNKLTSYQEKWKSYVASKWKTSELFAQIIYHKLTDNQWDDALVLIKELTPEELFDIVFEFEFKRGLRLLPKAIMHMPLDIANDIRTALS